MAVTGFDDSPAASPPVPALTTMRRPFDRISEEMVRMLLGAIDGQRPVAFVVPTDLVERDSA